jgi:hypothetical protein
MRAPVPAPTTAPVFRATADGDMLPRMPSPYLRCASCAHRPLGPLRPLARLVALVALLASCNAPSQQDMQTVQALTELGESFNDLRLVQQELQDQVDSLRSVVARQDSVIRTLANLAGVVMPPR